MKYPRAFFALTLMVATMFTGDSAVYSSENKNGKEENFYSLGEFERLFMDKTKT